MKNKKILIVSNFPNGEKVFNGQSLKAMSLINALNKENYIVKKFDYSQYKKKPFSTFTKFLFSSLSNSIIIILPDKGALKFLLFFYSLFIFKKKDIFYSVVGGWLPSSLENGEYTNQIKKLKKIKGIWVEKKQMVLDLNKLGISNVCLIENFKEYNDEVKKISFEDFLTNKGKYCFLSRVVPDKGIIETIKAISIAHKLDSNIRLDIYGPITNSFRPEFERLVKENSECVFYKGIADPFKANEILSRYYMQFFLTKEKSEGIPGSIIDSFAAGVPVIFAPWDNQTLLTHMGNGLECSASNIEGIVKTILFSTENPKVIYNMKEQCFISYKNFASDSIIKKVIKEIKK